MSIRVLPSTKRSNPNGGFDVGRALLFVIFVVTVLGIAGAATAQGESDLRLRLRRDFGFGSGAQMQGRFSLIVDDVDGLARVAFFVDDAQVGEDVEAPYRLQFSTGNYDLGWHSLHAVGMMSDGRELVSNTLQRQFVSGNSSVVIVVGAVLLVLGLRVASHLVTREKETSSKRGYGIYGGAICPRCGHPFSRHWWAPNLIAGKLDRCPDCGKWHFSTRATPQMLASAEAFVDHLDAEEMAEIPHEGEEARLRKRLEESRFDDQ